MAGIQLFYHLIGYSYLWIRYRNKEKINAVLIKDYENNYREVGFLVIWKPIGFIFLCLIATMLIACVIGIYRFGIK